ncbi:adenine deaminase C-terminal domain-containing protein [Pediococcus ethanolidurans]|uniref:Adenine deaminase n=1 Tax=Pediococcus ethanolidurans TaxID=319653 RepID=A0A0R2K997_9LACO|nr:adenine deaminase C-terminal domain-containing protein [Pediococcus ethanolidurans]KRN83063.1 adenine deaminase [Pediococcus ethanolidurans]GEN94217.1 adenine deaminase [Pediococcus ethanolidurans]SER09118.1 adenine deaminase [Pediococcus ethanolidurans]
MVTVDLLITNAQVYNSVSRQFRLVNVSVVNGKFYWLTKNIDTIQPKKILNLKGKYLVPGLVDSHMHIESSMTTPTAFGQAVAQYGTTTIIADAHEITNVAGIDGLKAFMAQPIPIDAFYALPSSVPSTTSAMETTGGVIGVAETQELLKDPRIICLGEAMNFQGITADPTSMIRQIIDVCRRARPTMPLEGHCPKYTGLDLAKFIFSGITSDHTQQTPESLVEKVMNGMFVQLQRKSLNAEVIKTVQKEQLFEHVALVTDDVMADDLRQGHLDQIVRLAIKLGLQPELAIYMATYTPARRMGLWDRGQIAPGRIADFIVLNNLQDFKIDAVYKSGKKVITNDASPVKSNFPPYLLHTIKARPLTADDLQLTIDQPNGEVTANIISISPKGTFTKREQMQLLVKNHRVDWQSAGLSLAVVQERYGRTGNLAFALVKNALSKAGAVGATWAHDHHNILLLGTDIQEIVRVQNKLVEEQGGYVVASNGKIVANAPLPVGGVVSTVPIAELGKQIAQVRLQMQALGYHNTNEIMSFSTLSLLVSPELKISDRGMFDVKSQRPVALFPNLE